MSGIATATRAMVDACEGSSAQILETRKTVPGLRVLDKWAVLIGGGCNHRMGLYDMIMIKDNHIAAAGGLCTAVDQACQFVRQQPKRIEIEVETRTLEEVRQVVECIAADTEGLVSRVMLDNMAKRDAACDGAAGSLLCCTGPAVLSRAATLCCSTAGVIGYGLCGSQVYGACGVAVRGPGLCMPSKPTGTTTVLFASSWWQRIWPGCLAAVQVGAWPEAGDVVQEGLISACSWRP